MAIRRNPKFRFDYFLRSLPVDFLARRCEQLARAAEKEVEFLERKAREDAGLPVEPEKEGDELPRVKLPKFRILRAQQRKEKQEKAVLEKKQLEENVNNIEQQIREIKARLAALNEDSSIARVSPDGQEAPSSGNKHRRASNHSQSKRSSKLHTPPERDDGAMGPEGEFVEFPEYDGSEEPFEWKKPFTHFCIRTRKEVKKSLDPEQRKDKVCHNCAVTGSLLPIHTHSPTCRKRSMAS